MEDNKVYDISEIDLATRIAVNEPNDTQMLSSLKKVTNARICIGKSGPRMKTLDYLRFRADHAIANDAVLTEVDERIVEELGFLKVTTLCRDKDEYITRPDLGRNFSKETLEYISENCKHDVDVQIIAGDGLSAPAIMANLKDIYPMLMDGFKAKGLSVGTPIYVKYARVATMDKISEALNAKVTIILIGERPGLATGESMSAYMAYMSSTKKNESQRNVVSNIHRKGMPPVEAGAQIVSLVELFLREKKSGVDLKI